MSNPNPPPAGKPIPPVSPATQRRLLTTLLKTVSRAFYLSLRILPTPIRQPIALAYLLARAADTIADANPLPPNHRLAHLRLLQSHLADPDASATFPPELAEIPDTDASATFPTSAERHLLQSLPDIFALLHTLTPPDHARVRNVVLTLTRGMQTDLTTFPPTESGSPNNITALPTERDLHNYTYLIAGCVGEFWTQTLIAHTPALHHWRPDHMAALGVQFGIALQLTNIIRDAPQDLRQGRCYLPQSQLTRARLSPQDLLAATNTPTNPLAETNIRDTRPLLAWATRRALRNYAAATDYILAIPRRCLRLRLAALWPALIGLQTLALIARHPNWLAASSPVKVPRRSVYAMIALSLLCARSNRALKFWLTRLTRRVERALNSQPPCQ